MKGCKNAMKICEPSALLSQGRGMPHSPHSDKASSVLRQQIDSRADDPEGATHFSDEESLASFYREMRDPDHQAGQINSWINSQILNTGLGQMQIRSKEGP